MDLLDADDFDLGETAGWLAGAVLGAIVGVAGAAMAVRTMGSQQGASSQQRAVEPQQPKASPKELLQRCMQTCEEAKVGLVADMKQVSGNPSRTVCQMAINAMNHCIAECHTAAGALS